MTSRGCVGSFLIVLVVSILAAIVGLLTGFAQYLYFALGLPLLGLALGGSYLLLQYLVGRMVIWGIKTALVVSELAGATFGVIVAAVLAYSVFHWFWASLYVHDLLAGQAEVSDILDVLLYVIITIPGAGLLGLQVVRELASEREFSEFVFYVWGLGSLYLLYRGGAVGWKAAEIIRKALEAVKQKLIQSAEKSEQIGGRVSRSLEDSDSP